MNSRRRVNSTVIPLPCTFVDFRLKDKKMRALTLGSFILIACFSSGCNPNRQNNEITNGGISETKEQKLKFPGLTPEPYVIPIDEPTFIQVVTNSTQIARSLDGVLRL